METIQESGDKTSTMPGMLPEADLFSVVRPYEQKTETEVSAAVDGLHGRSSSLNVHLARKASMRMRQWVKRSNTSRTAVTSGVSASESFKAHIKHLGGGRLEEEVVAEGPANNTTLLAPAPRRAHKGRPGSPDSRLTQWFDFYPEHSETSKSRAHTFPASLPSQEKRPSQRQPRQRSGSNLDLRPAPLRVPSSERKGGSSSGSTPPKGLTRKDSKWKPLPLLPAQPVIPKRSEADTTLEPLAGTKAGPKNEEPKSNAATSPLAHTKPSPERVDPVDLLPMITFGTPPPTPDSSTGGAAKTHLATDKGKAKDTGKRDTAESSNSSSRTTRETRHAKPKTDEILRHTREERIWLHVNYRGEARFLKAWGLDIARAADRVEGLAILRDLMAAEKQEGGEEDTRAVV